MRPEEHHINVSATVSVSYTDQGEGQSYLLLHGGAGPGSMRGFADALAANGRVLLPTHPGFNRTPRAEGFVSVKDLARAYVTLLEKLDLRSVIIIGNSMGGWIAAEMALLASPRVKGLVLLNAVGIEPEAGRPAIVDPLVVPVTERAALSFHNPQKFSVAPSSPEALALFLENQTTLRLYSGQTFSYDPELRSRLKAVAVPALVIWGTSDRIVDVDYGRLFARSLGSARFEAVAEAGHFPHIEQADKVLALVNGFVGAR